MYPHVKNSTTHLTLVLSLPGGRSVKLADEPSTQLFSPLFSTGPLEPGGRGQSPFQVYADILTLFQLGGADYTHNITSLPTPLRIFGPSDGPVTDTNRTQEESSRWFTYTYHALNVVQHTVRFLQFWLRVRNSYLYSSDAWFKQTYFT